MILDDADPHKRLAAENAPARGASASKGTRRGALLGELYELGGWVIPCYSADHPDPAKAKRPACAKGWHLVRPSLDEVYRAPAHGLIWGSLERALVDVDVIKERPPRERVRQGLAGADFVIDGMGTPCLSRGTYSGGQHLIYPGPCDPLRRGNGYWGDFRDTRRPHGETRCENGGYGFLHLHLPDADEWLEQLVHLVREGAPAPLDRERWEWLYGTHKAAEKDGGGGGRHDRARAATKRLAERLASEADVEKAREQFVLDVADRASPEAARAEFDRLMDGANAKYAPECGPRCDAPVHTDPQVDVQACERALHEWGERRLPVPPDAPPAPPPVGGEPMQDDGAHPLSEHGLAAWIVDEGHARDLRCRADLHQWLMWEEGAWRECDARTVEAYLRIVTHGVLHKLDRSGECVPDPVRGGSEGFLSRVRKCLGALAPVYTLSALWDAHPHLLGVRGGKVVDLRDCTTRDRTREDLILREAPTAPAALEGSRFAAFIEEAFPCGHTRLAAQVGLGSSLSPDPGAHLHLVQGKKRSGKSTLAKAILGAIGPLGVPSLPALITKDADSFTRFNARAQLQGVRLAIVQELVMGSVMSEEAIKILGGGGDAVTSRKIGGNTYWFDPTHTIIAVGNHLPYLARRDESIEDRLRIYPMDEVRPENEREPLRQVFATDRERGACLTWLIQGYALARRSGQVPLSPSMQARRALWLRTCEPFGSFLDECCDSDGSSLVREILVACRAWCKAQDIVRPAYLRSPQALRAELVERGYDLHESRHGRQLAVTGIRVLDRDS